MRFQAGQAALVCRAALLRLLIALVCKIFPYRFWRSLVRAAMRGNAAPVAPVHGSVADVIRAIEATDHWMPVGRCVERSLTAWLLVRQLAAARVRVGVERDAARGVAAHAYLEVNGEVVLSAPVDRFSPLNGEGAA
jgi:hypothetical protein